MSTPKIRPSDYPFAGPPTATPRTQALWMKHHAFFTEEEATEALCDFRDHGNLLETELAAERAIVSRIWVQLGSPTYAELNGRSIYDLIDEIKTARAEAKQGAAHYMSVAQKATDELARLRAELVVEKNWVEHHSQHADDLIAENVKLRADLERFTGDGLLDCHMICDQRDAAIARAERAEAALAEAKVERETVAEASLRSLEAYIDKLKQFDDRAEKAEAALAEWSVLNLWGGTPEIIHEFIKGQQNRIHHCQDLEAECLEQARLLGMSGEREADLLGKIARLNRVIERASVKFFHDGSDGETAAKMLTVLNEAK